MSITLIISCQKNKLSISSNNSAR